MLRAKFSADASKRENSDDVMGWNILSGTGVTTALKIVQWPTTSGGQPHQTTEKTVRMFLCHHALFSHNTQFLHSKFLASSWGGWDTLWGLVSLPHATPISEEKWWQF